MSQANKITISRIALIPIMLTVFFIDFPFHLLISAIVFVIAASTDFLDGYIARKTGTVSTFGKFLDPIADKILVAVALLMIIAGDFLYNPIILAVICASIILARELLIDGFRLVAAGKNVIIAADKLGKAKTLASDIALALILSNLHILVSYAGWIILIIATLLTAISGINYVVKYKKVFI